MSHMHTPLAGYEFARSPRPHGSRRACGLLAAASMGLATTFLGAGAYATASDQGTLLGSPQQLAQVVITATKRTTTVQDTAASITAITAAEISDRGITDFNSLAQSVPGLAMRTAGPGQTEFEMRGLNSSGGNTSMVGFYFDDISLSAPAAAQLGKVVIDPNLYDLNRVEVLHGPQGTLYGASSMGGTVRLVPNAPQLGKFAATGEEVLSDTASGGGLNHEENGMLNLPLGSTAAVRIVGSFTRDSGWIKRLVIQDGAVAVDSGTFPTVSRPGNFYAAPLQVTYNGVNTTNVDSVRASLLWKPAGNLSITPTLMYQLTQQGGPNNVDVNGSPTHPTVPAINAHYEIYDTPEPQRDRFTLGSLKVVYQLPAFSLTSATGYWNRGLWVSQDATEEIAAAVGIPVYDAAAGGVGPSGPTPYGPGAVERDYTRQLSEEFRATSTGAGPFQWLLGYFYQDFNSDWDLWMYNPQATPVLGGTIAGVGYQPQTITQNSFFGEFSWRFSPHLKATLGLRHYHYSLNQSNTEFGVFTTLGNEGDNVPYITHASNGASGTVPKFDLMYNIDGNHMVYATVSKGFRLGGVNQPVPVGTGSSANAYMVANECALQAKLLNQSCNSNLLLQGPTGFGSDSVWNYEIGEKSTLLHHRMTLDVSGYYERWLNPQLATNLAGLGITANGGNARIEGVEGELRALLTEDWDILIDAGYTSAKFTQSSAIIGYPKGLSVPDTPKLTASAVLHWQHPISDNLSLFGSLEDDYVGSRTDAPYGETITLWNYNQYLIHLPSYSLVNLRLGVMADRWSAALFVDNVANREVLLDPQPQIALQIGAFTRYTVNQPLTAGIDLSYRFD
jgi:iron complex outermembrane receptor protein